MNQWRKLLIGATPFVVFAGSLGAQASKGPAAKSATATKAKAAQGPKFEVDMLWPAPMPNRWILGSAVGVAVDARDHVFVLNIPDYFTARTEIGSGTNPTTGECCTPAPAVLEYDPQGALVGHWGGPGAGGDWPATPSGIAVDPQGNIWIGGSGGGDTRLLEFSHDGKFLMAVGKPMSFSTPTTAAAAPDTAYAGVSRGAAGGRGAGRGRGGRGRGGGPSLPPNSTSTEAFGGATSISFDAAANEAFVADGARNRRVAVIDTKTGAIKRFWGAYGNKPDDTKPAPYSPGATPSQQFGTPVACAQLSKDGMVYVCDRSNDRIQVFKKDGSFVKEKIIAPATLGDGSVWDVAFSRDPQQTYLYVADGMNMKIWVLDRATLEVITSFGDGGRQPGQFYAPHSVATDSKGNLFTGETYEGKRVQKFTYKGVGAVTTTNEGILWPRAGSAKP
jgi:DNA-binding beta-propeller fold protein YncE